MVTNTTLHWYTLQEANSTATDLALLLYKDYVRRWLLKLHGYECQEAEGEFMLAFFNPIPAIQFCLQVIPLRFEKVSDPRSSELDPAALRQHARLLLFPSMPCTSASR